MSTRLPVTYENHFALLTALTVKEIACNNLEKARTKEKLQLTSIPAIAGATTEQVLLSLGSQ